MATREELKALIDQIPDGQLDSVNANLNYILHPPAPNPRVEQFKQRSEEFRKQLPERLKQLQAGNNPNGISGFIGGGGAGAIGIERQAAYGRYSHSWQEDTTHVTHWMILHAGHEMDIIERLKISDDGKFLCYQQELHSCGHEIKRQEKFPLTDAPQ